MRLVSRNDTSLAAALIVGTFVLFRQPLTFLLAAASDVERTYHIDLVQALLVLGIVFAFHQYRKRQEARTDLAAAATEAKQARIRSEELERLVGLSRALASASDFTRLNQVISRHLPKFTNDRSFWFLICQHGCWDVLVRDLDDRRSSEELEALAERTFAAGSRTAETDHVVLDGMVSVPMMVGAHAVGTIIVSNSPAMSPEECRALEAAAALTGIAIRNIQTIVETRETSLRDGLTGCFNRAHALETLKGELRRADRAGSPLSMIMFDVDKFKHVNDTHGHLAGDHLLAEVGQRLGTVLRTSDVKCRYGGDEFLIILPDTPALGARQVAESIRQEMSRIVLKAGDANVKVTVSVGVATADHEQNPQAFIARADGALYQAKRTGRNRVHSDDIAQAAPPLRLVQVAV